MKTALISVTDKNGLDELVAFLLKNDFQIISSGGTGRYIEELGHSYIPIEEITKNPEAFAGRMKTLSFQVGSGILFRRDCPNDRKEQEELGITPIDLVVCNLYSFDKVLKEGASLETLIENIDIGGPTMIRAAAKNFKDVSVLTSPNQYKEFIADFTATGQGENSLKFRSHLALSAFKYTSQYETMIFEGLMPNICDAQEKLRYGENPHQEAYVIPSSFSQNSLCHVIPKQGKKLSYNNYLDSDASYRAMVDLHKHFGGKGKYCVSVVKHSNPCGLAVADTPLKALELAWNGDPVSSFGSIISFDFPLDEECANFLIERFVEVVIAPGFSPKALSAFSLKKNLRLLELPIDMNILDEPMKVKLWGGELIQSADNKFDYPLEIVTKHKSIEEKEKLSRFGILSAKYLKSNAISLVSQFGEESFSIVGGGMGNPNRLISLKEACEKAKENGLKDLSNCVLVSDAFFPFPDNIHLANEYGVKNIVQPGGSIKDNKVIEACNDLGISMSFSSHRHFRH